MAKIFLWIAAVALAVYIVKSELITSKTYGPFVEACQKGEGATQERCECLGRYMHKHFSDNEMKVIMAQKADGAFAQKVEEVVAAGAQSCRTP
ncbi:MAG: hypothetical protein ACPGPF_02675 [Pontibacterium sp.]